MTAFRAPSGGPKLLNFFAICCLAASSLQAQDYVIGDSQSRGTLVVDGTSMGGFTATPTFMDFQGTVTPGNFSTTIVFPNLIANPLFNQAGQTIELTYTSKEGFTTAPVSFTAYIPNTTNGGDPVTFDATSSFRFTDPNGGALLRFSGSLTTASGGTASITGGLDYTANPQTASSSYSVRPDSVTFETAKSSGLMSGPTSGKSTLILNAGSTLSVAGGTGTLNLGPSADNYGILQIGNGGAAGRVLVNEITAGVGGGQVAFNQSDEITFAPLISGNTSLLKAGTGTVEIARANTYTAGTFMNGGTLITRDSFALGTGPITASGTSSILVYNDLTLTNGTITVLDGLLTIAPGSSGSTLTTPGGLNKLGPGILRVLTDVLVNGTMTVTADTLVVDSTLTAQDLIVEQGSFLKGRGTVIANVLNDGHVAPGNSPGTLTITGNFTQTSGGALDIEIASPTNLDQLIISGIASLAGTLNVIPYDGYQLEYGQRYTFLRAGSITGEFDSIVTPEGFRGRVLESGGTLTLLFAPSSYALAAQTGNQRNVATSLNSFIPATSGDRQFISETLDFLSADQYPAAFEAVMPSFYSSLPQISLEQITAQNQFITQRLSAIRLGANGFNAQGLNMPLTSDRDGKSVMEAKDAKTIITPANATKWGLWVQGNGIFGRMSLTSLPTNRYASGGFLGGADYRWSESFSAGLYSGYQGTYSKYSNNSSTQINSTLFGLYATYQQGGFYSDAIVGGAYNNYSNRRAIEFSTIDRTAQSDVGGGQLTAYLDAGYDWHLGRFTLGPLASLQYTYTGLGGFTENGADSLDLAVDQYNANSIRTNLGGRIAYTWSIARNILLIPEVRIFWQHEYLNDQQTMTASLDAGASPAFGYQPSATGQDSVFAAAGASLQFGPNWNAYFYYNADFGRQDYVGQMISTGLNWNF